MHISDEHRAAFLSIPYTKSTSTRKWLERKYGFRQIGYQHSIEAPDDYFVWTVIREPKDRAVSLWRRIHRAPERELLRLCHFSKTAIPETFTDWMRVLVTEQPIGYRVNGRADLGARQFWSQASLLGDARVDRFFRFEDVPDAFIELPFVTATDDFPHYSGNNRLPGLTWDDVATDEAEELVWQWAGIDFALYKEAGS